MNRSRYIASAVVLVSSAALQAAPRPATLHGVVVDTTGKPVAGANVTVYRDGVVIAQPATNADGVFTFQGVPREYRVGITAPGFGDLSTSSIPFAARSTTRFMLRSPGAVAGLGSGSMVRDASSGSAVEFGLLAQGGVGTGDRSSYRFFLLGGHAGKVLTPNLGSGLLQGNFEYAVEVFPFWQSYTPRFSKIACSADPPTPVGTYTCSQPYTVGGTYTGVSVTPIMLRWNLTHGRRWMPWLQGAGGVVWTNHKYPAIGNTNPLDTASNGPHGDTSVWNFTPQFGVGTHYFVRSKQSLDFSANAVHVSSASLGDKNPGVNASVQFSLGYSWWK